MDLVKRFGQERYEFYFNETSTHQILKDVKNRIGDLGVIYLSRGNETVLCKAMGDLQLRFVPLFSAKPHVFLWKEHPLAKNGGLRLADLQPCPRLNFGQGSYESAYYSEELFSTVPFQKQIRINDRGAIVNIVLALTLLECVYSMLWQ